ncbi:hypothetical protein CXG81DRAFT_15040 [Caulochytrium protostelioides]|uniref:Zinc finger ZPR1-type domain-containing protein n=1 Tax=Caulochytrium protostelioides TaxID=1555241 RepID=A0A4P9X1R8_9FUNG|nr:hypothetical protein CXG81DRAFT_15040 [Caulochytrium protostelioides]|eukprot:RKO99085.1 hypothetical protein CXG81DRAFT_15040 [Caulochytrium protostelioides]
MADAEHIAPLEKRACISGDEPTVGAVVPPSPEHGADGEQKDELYENLNAGNSVTEVESLCMQCEEQGMTRIMLTRIPHFREIILMAFECPHCGNRNNEVQSGALVSTQGSRQSVRVTTKADLNRQVVKSESATVIIPELEFEIPPLTQKGVLSTIEGVIETARTHLAAGQPVRKTACPEVHDQLEVVLGKLAALSETLNFTFIVDDPAGNSYVENPHAPLPDPQMSLSFYTRTPAHNEALGLAADDNNAMDVLGFMGACPNCQAPCETKMHPTEIPHFKEVIIMATTCEACGFKNNEIKTGGAIVDHGTRIELRMTDGDDLSRDILKSETCALSIPELELEVTTGTLGGRFTTVEGLLQQVKEQLITGTAAPFHRGDSAAAAAELDPEREAAFARFAAKLDRALTVSEPYTLVLDDPLSNSYLQNPYAPDPDPAMTITTYERTFEQNEAFGLNDLVV